MASLSNMFDGQPYWLEPGEYFPTTGAGLIIDGWEQGEEEDVLSPFESPTQEPILRQTYDRDDKHREMFPLAATEQAWGCLSVNLSALATIMGFKKKQYQYNWPREGSVRGQTKWSFQTDEPVAERL